MKRKAINPKIISLRKFSKSNDLPIFVQLMIQKDREAVRAKREVLKEKCMLEAQQLMAVDVDNHDRVFVKQLPNQVGVQLLYPYEDSNPPKINDFEIVSNNVPQEQNVKVNKGLTQEDGLTVRKTETEKPLNKEQKALAKKQLHENCWCNGSSYKQYLADCNRQVQEIVA